MDLSIIRIAELLEITVTDRQTECEYYLLLDLPMARKLIYELKQHLPEYSETKEED